MSTFSFLKDPVVERASLELFIEALPAFEQHVDTAMITLETYTTAALNLDNVAVSFEAMDVISDRELSLVRMAMENAIAPIGLDLNKVVGSLEDNKPGAIQRLKDLLIRLIRTIRATAGRIWQYLKQAFAKVYAQHRAIQNQISNARVVLSKSQSMLHTSNAITGADGLTALTRSTTAGNKVPATFTEMVSHLDQFNNVRKAFTERYPTKLSAAMNNLLSVARGEVDLRDSERILKLRTESRKALALFDLSSLAGMFPGGVELDKQEGRATVQITGGYEVAISGSYKLPPVEDPGFAKAARELSIDIRSSGNNDPKFSIAAYGHNEIKTILDYAERMVRDMTSGRLADRVKLFEAKVTGYGAFVEDSLKVLNDPNLTEETMPTATRDVVKSVFMEQAALVNSFTSWGGPVFLKMETLTLRVATALVRLAQDQLRNFA